MNSNYTDEYLVGEKSSCIIDNDIYQLRGFAGCIRRKFQYGTLVSYEG